MFLEFGTLYPTLRPDNVGIQPSDSAETKPVQQLFKHEYSAGNRYKTGIWNFTGIAVIYKNNAGSLFL